MGPVRCRHLFLLSFGLISLASANPVPDGSQPETVTVTTGPSIASAAPQFVDKTAFTSAILNSTNFFRSEHNATAVVYNDTLSDFASDYLNGDGCDFKHSGGPYGENLALGCSDVTGCVELWGDERSTYDYDHPDFTEATGHFTQLVWKNTTAVGCGSQLCGDSGWFLVCEYWPRGNVIGEFGDEVGRQVNGTGSAGAVVRPTLGWQLMFGIAVSLFCI